MKTTSVIRSVTYLLFAATSAQEQQQGPCSSSDGIGASSSSSLQCGINVSAYDELVDLAPALDPSFLGFAFEQAAFLNYAGYAGAPNVFSQNLIGEITKRTKSRPSIRVGGTTLDIWSRGYNPRQKKPLLLPKKQRKQNAPHGQKYGPSYFDSFASFPDARYIFTVPLATGDLANAVLFASAGYKTISKVASVEAIAIGNEPNSYAGMERPLDYGPSQWVAEFKNYSNAISAALNMSLDSPLYDAEALAAMAGNGGVASQSRLWSQPSIFNAGLNDVIGRVKSVSMHYYQMHAFRKDTDPDFSLQSKLMNHTAMVNNATLYKSSISYLAQKGPGGTGIPLNLAEVGSAIQQEGDSLAFQAYLGAALWQVDFVLYAMSLGVHRVNMQQGLGYTYSMWQPVLWNGKPPVVRAPYYAHLFAADFMASPNALEDGAGTVQVYNIDLNQDSLAAYVCYDSGVLTKLAVVNLQMWSPSSGWDRPSASLKFTLPGDAATQAGRSVTIKRLTSPLGAKAWNSADITWGGMSWNFENLGLPVESVGVENGEESMQADENGVVSVDIEASEAVMLILGDVASPGGDPGQGGGPV